MGHDTDIVVTRGGSSMESAPAVYVIEAVVELGNFARLIALDEPSGLLVKGFYELIIRGINFIKFHVSRGFYFWGHFIARY